jgi:RNA polymerase sigma-70 factor (ECF subfamily)
MTAAAPELERRAPYRGVLMGHAAQPRTLGTDDDSQAWLGALGGPAAVRQRAVEDLHALLLRAARHEHDRRRGSLAHVSPGERHDLAVQAADDALVAVLAKLHTFRGASRFTTWAYKFALLEAGVKARRRAWQGRELLLDEEAWPALVDPGPSALSTVHAADLLRAVREAMRTELTPYQREVFTALALNGVPIDVLAERRDTTRGALYKTLHDARRKLRRALADAGYGVDDDHPRPGGRS